MRNVGCEKPCHLQGQLGIEGGFLIAAHHCRVMGLPNKQGAMTRLKQPSVYGLWRGVH